MYLILGKICNYLRRNIHILKLYNLIINLYEYNLDLNYRKIFIVKFNLYSKYNFFVLDFESRLLKILFK